ncbi:pseudouridine synthase [Sphingomonas sp.]|jgi:23S rRNA pseudouridine2605 synthase|uniref:pseudouridine synthase n=1 Tax=Sphingomonas sp. TaxID=28214 RepID=UPI0035C8342C
MAVPTHRIAKLLARAGVASRREIERMIAEGRVALRGTPIDTPATLLPSLDGVTVDGNPVAEPEPARLFLYHKPSGLLTTERDPRGRPTIYDRLPTALPRVMPVGRLDLSTEGLLLLTTDGGLKRTLELPATGVERSYRARAYGAVSQEALESLVEGIEIDGVRYGSIDANLERRTGANTWIELTLTEGKNREVRRVLEHLGLKVSRLIRTRYGPFHLGDMPAGEVVEVRRHDVESLAANPRRKDLPQPRRRAPAPAKPIVEKPAPVKAAAPKAAGKPKRPEGKVVRKRADGSLAVRGGERRAARAKAFRGDAPRTPGKR